MRYKVYVISDAEEDIFEIYNYITITDSHEKAEHLFYKLKETCQSLSTFPDLGHIPPELQRIGVFDFQEIHCKPYRIIYQIVESEIYIHCILDGRRDLIELLENRLIR